MNGNKIIHVHFKDDGHDEYFGSLTAIYQTHGVGDIGVTLQTLWNNHIGPSNPYENRYVVIKEGVIVRNQTKRFNPKLK